MLATLVIGLREGLEAALIVGIVAAFLKRNGRSLTAMWWGVAAAVGASLAVGVGLWLLEASLPQAAQEGLETVIGGVAVVFVTGMILWMSGHARTLKRELETSAADALGAGTAGALAVMAFLAVLKEGFETAVFLIATFRAATTPALAATGALLGIALSVALGVGIYYGGVHLNLARFFRITGVFLLLVAAGLVLTAVRTAHEAGWLQGGQQRTVDLAWIAPPGSVQASLVTGVLGIPADPRLIEVVAWLAYLVPMALVMFLPARLKPTGAAAFRTRIGLAVSLAAAGAVVAAVAAAASLPAGPVPLAMSGGGSAVLRGDRLELVRGGSATAAVLDAGAGTTHRGVTAEQRTGSVRATGAGPQRITLEQLIAAAGGRVPVGVDPARARGPFAASWSTSSAVTAWTAGGRAIDAEVATTRVLTVSGGGLTGSRTLTAGAPVVSAATPGSAADVIAAVQRDATVATDRVLWTAQVPAVLLIAAALLAATALLRRRRVRAADLRPAGSTSHAFH